MQELKSKILCQVLWKRKQLQKPQQSDDYSLFFVIEIEWEMKVLRWPLPLPKAWGIRVAFVTELAQMSCLMWHSKDISETSDSSFCHFSPQPPQPKWRLWDLCNPPHGSRVLGGTDVQYPPNYLTPMPPVSSNNPFCNFSKSRVTGEGIGRQWGDLTDS